MSHYTAVLRQVKEVFVERLGVTPQHWSCQCGRPTCKSQVVYARGPEGKVYFIATVTTRLGPVPVVSIDNVEDLALLLESALLPPGDLVMYRIWLAQGLKEVLLNA